MAFTVRLLPCFERQLKETIKNYPNSEAAVREKITGLGADHSAGNRFPGFGQLHIRKTRIALKSYNIGESKGLRLIFMIIESKGLVIPVVLYKKGHINSESEVLNLVKTQLKSVLKDLT